MDKRLEYIDALRGYAIFAVLFTHIGAGYLNKPHWLDLIAIEGGRGVQLFYIVSALTLFMSLESRLNEPRPYLSFLIRRFFRIAPLFYVAIIVFLLKDGFNSVNTVGNIITHIFFINGFSPYYINTLVIGGWSVAIEMLFYLFVPFFYKKIKTLCSAVLLFLFSMIISFSLILLLLRNQLIPESGLWHSYLLYWLPTQLPIFSLGFVLFFAQKKLKDKVKGNKISLLLTFVSIASILVLIYMPRFINEVAFIYPFGIAFVLFSYSLSIYQSPLFVNRFWRYLGKISYSMYLLHFVVLTLVYNIVGFICKFATLSDTLKLLIGMAILVLLTSIVASFTYNFIEKPGMLLGKRIINKIKMRNNVELITLKRVKA